MEYKALGRSVEVLGNSLASVYQGYRFSRLDALASERTESFRLVQTGKEKFGRFENLILAGNPLQIAGPHGSRKYQVCIHSGIRGEEIREILEPFQLISGQGGSID